MIFYPIAPGDAIHPTSWLLDVVPMGSVRQAMSAVEPTLTTLDSMELQYVFHPLPEVRIPYRHHLSEVLPSPAVIAPLRQAIEDALLDVAGAAD